MDLFKAQLEKSKFEGLSFSEEQIQAMVTSKPRGLMFTNCELTPQNIKKLSEAASLVNVTIENCKLTDEHLKYLAGLPKLEYLFIPRNAIQGQGFSHFLGHKKLSTIWLDDNPLNDEGLKIIASLPKVSIVRIANTQVTLDGLMAVAGNAKLKPVVSDLKTKEMLFPKEEMEEFERLQRYQAKKKKDADPAIVRAAEKALQSFFHAYSELERFASQQENTFSQEVKDKYQQLLKQHCSVANHQNSLGSISMTEPDHTFGDHKIVDNEQVSKSKIYIYTKNRWNNYRTLLVLENEKWVVDKQQWNYEGWSKSYF
ncbi:MAG: NTF2 fold immunity protein [Saezia sp.]